jgi:hypothetical protein
MKKFMTDSDREKSHDSYQNPSINNGNYLSRKRRRKQKNGGRKNEVTKVNNMPNFNQSDLKHKKYAKENHQINNNEHIKTQNVYENCMKVKLIPCDDLFNLQDKYKSLSLVTNKEIAIEYFARYICIKQKLPVQFRESIVFYLIDEKNVILIKRRIN